MGWQKNLLISQCFHIYLPIVCECEVTEPQTQNLTVTEPGELLFNWIYPDVSLFSASTYIFPLTSVLLDLFVQSEKENSGASSSHMVTEYLLFKQTDENQ